MLPRMTTPDDRREPAAPGFLASYRTTPPGDWFLARVTAVGSGSPQTYSFDEWWLKGDGTWGAKAGGRVGDKTKNPGYTLPAADLSEQLLAVGDFAHVRGGDGAGLLYWEMLPAAGSGSAADATTTYLGKVTATNSNGTHTVRRMEWQSSGGAFVFNLVESAGPIDVTAYLTTSATAAVPDITPANLPVGTIVEYWAMPEDPTRHWCRPCTYAKSGKPGLVSEGSQSFSGIKSCLDGVYVNDSTGLEKSGTVTFGVSDPYSVPTTAYTRTTTVSPSHLVVYSTGGSGGTGYSYVYSNRSGYEELWLRPGGVSNAGGLVVNVGVYAYYQVSDDKIYPGQTGTLIDGSVVKGGIVTTVGTGPIALGNGGTGVALSDPNADRIMFWDDSAGFVTWLAPNTGLAISGTNLNCTVQGMPTATTSGQIPVYDSGGGAWSVFSPGGTDGLMYWDFGVGWTVKTDGLTTKTFTVDDGGVSKTHTVTMENGRITQWDIM